MSEVTCKDAKEKVYDYLAQEVDDELKTAINDHLKDCVTCAGEYAIELQISSFISSSSLNRVSTEELVERAYSQLENDMAEASIKFNETLSAIDKSIAELKSSELEAKEEF